MRETEYEDDMLRHEDALPFFYEKLKQGIFPRTSQLNEYQYEAFFDALLKQGDVLHVVFGSGMTTSIENAMRAANTMRLRYPGRTLTVIDSLASSAGYGLLVCGAADLRDKGASLEEVASFLEFNRTRVHHQFFSCDLTYFKQSGRISGKTAFFGTLLNICPIMHLNLQGRIVAYDKARGKKNAIKMTLNEMERLADGGKYYSQPCFINHSNCLEDAKALKRALLARFVNLKEDMVPIFDIGTIIASHCGPGTVSIYFFGVERPEE